MTKITKPDVLQKSTVAEDNLKRHVRSKFRDEAIKALAGNIQFGSPTDPNDDQSTTLAGGTGAGAHNGEIINIKGSWVEVEIGANELDTAITCIHNLDIPIVAADEPNVRWIVFGKQYDRTNAGTKTYWEDLRAPGSFGRARAGGSPPTFELKAGGADPFTLMPLNWFSAGADEEISFEFHMPHSYVEGTDIFPHLHWVGDTAPGGVNLWPQWGLLYSWANMDTAVQSVFPAASTIYSDADSEPVVYSDDTTLVQNAHYVTRFNGDTGISGTGKDLDSVIVCQLFRDTASAGPGTDDYPGECGIISFDLHHQVDASHGSEFVDVKTDDTGEFINFDCYYDPSDTNVTVNSLPLRFTAHHNVQDSDTYKIKFTIFFIPAVR